MILTFITTIFIVINSSKFFCQFCYAEANNTKKTFPRGLQFLKRMTLFKHIFISRKNKYTKSVLFYFNGVKNSKKKKKKK